MATAKRENVTHPSAWAMESLVGNASLRLGIPDTILFKDGAPQIWLFTSKTGDVLNKRSLRKSSIKERFTRLFATNPNNPNQRVAMVRFMDGTVRNLGREAFKEMMNKFPATEPGIMSIQCYMQGKGASGTVYRNSYRVVNDKGLAVTGTSSFTTLPPDKTAAAAAAPSSTWSEREIKLEKCMASSINKALDAVTLSVVRYLEAEQDKPTRILSLRCDYVVDAASQIWLIWIGDTTIATADAARDLRLANVTVEGPRGRGEFLGQQNALDMQREFGGPPGPTKKSRRRGDDPATAAAAADQEVDIGKAVDRAAEVIELPREAVGAGGSGGISDLLSRVETAKKAAEGGLPAADPSSALVARSSSSTASAVVREQSNDAEATGRATTMSTMTVGVRNGEAWGVKGGGGKAPGEKRFPSSFACAGDFCKIRVLVGISSGDKNTAFNYSFAASDA